MAADNGQTDDTKDLREKYGFSADLSEEQLQQKLKEMREHLKREIRKVSVYCCDIRVEQRQST